jgi:hypothetical protein
MYGQARKSGDDAVVNNTKQLPHDVEMLQSVACTPRQDVSLLLPHRHTLARLDSHKPSLCNAWLYGTLSDKHDLVSFLFKACNGKLRMMCHDARKLSYV